MQTITPETLVAFFDTETSGLPVWNEPSGSANQPHIVEVAVLLYTADGAPLMKYCALVKPDGWEIHPEAQARHGITLEELERAGIDERVAVDRALELIEMASVRVAHVRSFDDRIFRIALKRFYGDEKAEEFKARAGECTALLAKPVCQIPGKKGIKQPTLGEALRHLTGGKEFEGAHRAFADAQACARVYFLLKGIRMPEFPDDAEALRNEQAPLPHGKDECDAVQIDIEEAAQCAE